MPLYLHFHCWKTLWLFFCLVRLCLHWLDYNWCMANTKWYASNPRVDWPNTLRLMMDQIVLISVEIHLLVVMDLDVERHWIVRSGIRRTLIHLGIHYYLSIRLSHWKDGVISCMLVSEQWEYQYSFIIGWLW